jgi:hypothetical protein
MTAKRNWLIFNMTVDVRERLQARPFTPFTVHVADGRKFDVATPDHAHSGVDVQDETNGQQNPT